MPPKAARKALRGTKIGPRNPVTAINHPGTTKISTDSKRGREVTDVKCGSNRRNPATSIAGNKEKEKQRDKYEKQEKSKVRIQDRMKTESTITVWKKEDAMACRIQTYYRGYRCRKMLLYLKKKREEYNLQMENLHREAFVQVVRLEQKRAEAKIKEMETKKVKKQEERKRVKRMLDAAFDGKKEEIERLMKEVFEVYKERGEDIVHSFQYRLVESSDLNQNTPLSEAAAGGDSSTIEFLINIGANPNTKGQYGRTPLYRATFGGHLEAVKVLLKHGADPRITADDGTTPAQVASLKSVECVLKEWKIENTEKYLLLLEQSQKRRKEAERKMNISIESKLQMVVNEAEKEFLSKQKQLSKAHEELNKRIYEHDENVTSGAVKADITLMSVHDAEALLESAKVVADTAREKLSQAKLHLRTMKREFHSGDGDCSEESNQEHMDIVINIRELDDVLLKDVGNRIEQSGRWPLLIDPSKQAATFLRYRDTNYLNCCNPRHMEPEVIRMAVLGSIRYGKFLVLDLLDVYDLLPGVEQKMEVVQRSLFANIMNKSLIMQSKYLSMIRPSDGEQYAPKMFSVDKVSRFRLVVLTQLFSPPKELLQKFYTIRIHVHMET